MTEEEIKDKLRKMLSSTKRANECGLSNNDFNEDIDTLSGALGLLDKKDKVIDKLQKENKELKEDNSHQWEGRCRLTFELGKLQKELEEKTTILMAGADKVKQLEKENTDLKRCIDAQKIMRKDMPKDTKLILMYSEDYKRLFKEE